MIYPTINDLTKGEYNRYEIALATAKCARMITNEYTRQRQEAERAMTGNKETDKPLNTMIDKEVRDEKAVKLAIGRIYKGDYTIVHKDPAEQEKEEQAILAGLNRPYDDDYHYDPTADDEADPDDEEGGEELIGEDDITEGATEGAAEDAADDMTEDEDDAAHTDLSDETVSE